MSLVWKIVLKFVIKKKGRLIMLKKDEVFKKLYFILNDFVDEFSEDDNVNKMICFLCDRLEKDLELENKFFED